jgi:uncharacterized membrane protein (Fun14 family)
MSLGIESLVTPIGVGGFAGFLVGYAIRKVIKLIFMLVGIGIAFVLFLQSKGILNVDYQKLDAFAQNVTSSVINSTVPTTTTYNTSVISGSTIIHSILSVPMLGGATAGFLLGFMVG